MQDAQMTLHWTKYQPCKLLSHESTTAKTATENIILVAAAFHDCQFDQATNTFRVCIMGV